MFGNTRKIRSTVNDFRFNRKIPLFWCKMISVAIFTSKYFRTQTWIERERERERERRENVNLETDSDSDEPRNQLRLTEKTQDRENPFDCTQETHLIKPGKPIRQTQKTHLIAPSQTLIAPIGPPARLSHPNTDPPKTDRSRRTPKPIILVLFLLGIENLGFVSFGFWWIWVLSSTQLRRPRPKFVIPIHRTQSPLSLSLSLSLNLIEFDEFFLLGFVFLCLFTEKWY